MASITDLISNLPEAVEFNDFPKIKEKILTISPQMFENILNESEATINLIQSFANLLVKECPQSSVPIEDNHLFMESFKLDILQFRVYTSEFSKEYRKLCNDYIFYMDCELIFKQEKLISKSCESERESKFFKYNRPSESYPWNFKGDLESMRYNFENFRRSSVKLISGINALRRMENISEIKVVTDKFGHLTIN